MLHDPISDALIISERRPRRGLIAFFLRQYSILLGLSVTSIMLLAALPYAPFWTLTWVGLYWLYHFGKARLRDLTFFGRSFHEPPVQFCRSLLLALGITVFLGYLYGYTDYLTANGNQDTLWLLFLLSIFIMSQYGITELMLIIIGLAAVALVTIRLSAAPVWNPILIRNIILEASWLALLAFILHVLLRYLQDWSASVRLLHQIVADPTTQLSSVSDENHFLDLIVERIAADLEHAHVNILYRWPDGRIKYMAGACPAGRALARQGYVLRSSRGIINHVMDTGNEHSTNDVKKDNHYDPHPDFPDTKAELGVPIKLKGKVIGILDVQARKRSVFLTSDVEVMKIMATHIARAVDNIRLLHSRQQIGQIVESIARRFLSEHELQTTLNQIAQTAHEELKADVVVLYERNPVTDEVNGPVKAGDLYDEEAFNATVLEPDSLVYRLLKVSTPYRFDEDVANAAKLPLFAPTQYHIRSGILTFDQREQIKSRAIIRLETGTERVGLLFLNFRTQRKFEAHDEQMFFIFAHLAALAIQKAQFHQHALQVEREDLAKHLHHQLTSTADGLERLIFSISGASLSKTHRSHLLDAQELAQALKQDLTYLTETLKDTCLGDLYEEMEKIRQRIKRAYGVEVDVQWTGRHHQVSPAIAAQFRPIFDEAIRNAIRHGQATRIDFDIEVTDRLVNINIKDDGKGFAPKRTRSGGGLLDMRERIEKKMFGHFDLRSAPNEGTLIQITVPHTIWERGRDDGTESSP